MSARGRYLVQHFRNSNHIALIVGCGQNRMARQMVTTLGDRAILRPRGSTKPRVPTAPAKARTALVYLMKNRC
jgi:hypothetical protein